MIGNDFHSQLLECEGFFLDKMLHLHCVYPGLWHTFIDKTKKEEKSVVFPHTASLPLVTSSELLSISTSKSL